MTFFDLDAVGGYEMLTFVPSKTPTFQTETTHNLSLFFFGRRAILENSAVYGHHSRRSTLHEQIAVD